MSYSNFEYFHFLLPTIFIGGEGAGAPAPPHATALKLISHQTSEEVHISTALRFVIFLRLKFDPV